MGSAQNPPPRRSATSFSDGIICIVIQFVTTIVDGYPSTLNETNNPRTAIGVINILNEFFDKNFLSGQQLCALHQISD